MRLLPLCGLALGLVGCGTTVPEIREAWELDPAANRQITFGIKRRVFCELKHAVQEVNREIEFSRSADGGRTYRRYYPVPLEWGARLSLQLTVDERSGFAPSAAITERLPGAQSLVVGVGGEASSAATRVEKFDAFYTVKFLNEPFESNSTCFDENYRFWSNPSRSSPLITSDLRLRAWLEDAAFTARSLPSNDPKKVGAGTIPDTFSLQIKFAIVTTGNVNPSFRLTRVSTNSGGSPLLSTGRTRTHDLLLTIGPQTKETTDSHLASQIAQALGSNVGRLGPP